MNKGKLTVLVGGQYGSEGKGAVVAHIANEYDAHVRVGSPNAGHTIYWRGEKHVMQSIPCGWINPNADIIIGRGALLNMKQFMKELVHVLQFYPDFLSRLHIDPEAGILSEKFRDAEGGKNGWFNEKIGSTGEGVGAAREARIHRDTEVFKRFKDVAHEYGLEQCISENTPLLVAIEQDAGRNVLIEGTQGSGLSLLHSHYPYCTSIDTNAAGIISEVGIAPSRVTDVLMVVRTFPIRVAGNSGYMKNEITWEQLQQKMGVNITPEKTTVTQKIRRIAEWDADLFYQSCLLNAPTCIALTFADYIDPNVMDAVHPEDLLNSTRLMKFIKDSGINTKSHPLKYIGTGAKSMVTVNEGDFPIGQVRRF